MITWRVALLAVLASVSGLCCADAASRQQVVTSIRPLALIVRALAGDTLFVVTLPGVDASPHDFVLRPSGLNALQSAALFLWMGPTLEQPLVRVLERGAPVHALAVLPALGEDVHADPHLWLDPRRAIDIARVVSDDMQERGLFGAGHGATALAGFEAQMRARETAIAGEFAGLENVPFIVMHDGLRALVARFGLRQVGALSASHDVRPGARSLAALRSVARDAGAVCLFREAGDSEDLARTLAEGSAMRVVELDMLARSAPDSAQGFDLFLQTLAREMAGCLRAAPPPVTESH